MEYKIIEAKHHSALVEKVNTLLKQGWEPVGGVSFYAHYIYQALVKHD